MQREILVGKLGQALLPFGLELGRYTDALLDTFLQRFPDPDSWFSSAAQRAMVSTFAIGETMFLRDREHFRLLVELLPELNAKVSGRPLRVVSLGCASGEEAYSLVACLSAAGCRDFEVLGFDLNPEFISRARRGEYRPWSLRGVTDADTAGWLSPAPSGVKVEPWLAPFVRFEVSNLCTDRLPEQIDVLFCRNVLLYFRGERAQAVHHRIREALCPHGVLFLGHHDPRPTEATGLVATMRGGVTYFVRAARPKLGPDPANDVQPLLLSARIPGKEPISLEREAPGDLLAKARLLSRQGQLDEAQRVLDALLDKAPLLVDAHVLSAVVEEERGDVRRMLEAARRACFLAPDAAGPNYYMSVSFLRSGELRRAALHRRISVHALTRQLPARTVVPHSEGLTVSQLRRLVGAVTR